MGEILILAVPLVLVWLFFIRPQQRRQREAILMRQGLQPGVEIVTTSGFLGTVIEVTDEDVAVSLAPGVEVRMLKAAVGRIKPPGVPTADDPTAGPGEPPEEGTPRPD